ncbi:hypothetical protein [Sutterella wadsworthensis]|uniref:hypothetical protein n=1 Tax=Sutterella wadsworthensis TaxID=40545 RepID=UPI0032BF5EB4
MAKFWKSVDLKELNKYLKNHNVSSTDLEETIILNSRLIKEDKRNIFYSKLTKNK